MAPAAPVLVERDAQLETLRQVLRGPGRVAVIEGEPGAGKSVLLAAASRAERDARVWSARCEPLAIPAPFTALFELLPRLPAHVADPIRRRDAAIHVFAALLEELRTTPTVLIVDDLQWCDAATAGLVRYLARRIDDTASALAVAYRSGEIEPEGDTADTLRELGRVATRIALPPLTAEGVATLARQLAPRRHVDADAVRRATGGNPLFTVEVLRHGSGEVPATVGDVVSARVQRLPAGTRRVVEAISLCPDGIELDAALAIDPTAGVHIDDACRRGLLEVTPSRVQCRHDLVRAAIDATVPPVRRRELHRVLLELLEACPAAGDPARLAHHSAAAGDPERTVRYSVAAAHTAISAGTHRHAAEHLARALEHRSAIPNGQLDDLLRLAVHEMVLAGRYDQAIAVAEERLDRATEKEQRTEALAQLAFCWTRRGDYRQGHALAERAVRDSGDHGAPPPATAHLLLAHAALDRGDYLGGLAHANTAAEVATEPGELARALITSGTTMNLLGHDDWEAPLQRAVASAVEAHLDDAAAHALSNLANCLLAHYRLEAARERFEQAIEFCEARQLDAWLGPLVAGAARLELTAGDWETAALHLTSTPLAACLGSRAEVASVVALLALRAHGSGGAKVNDALAEHDRSATHWDRIDAATLLAEAAWLGDADRDAAAQRLVDALDAPGAPEDPWATARLLAWAGRLGISSNRIHARRALAGPHAREVAGDPAGAARAWAQLGCPYEAALAAYGAGQADAAATALDRIGAEAAARALRSGAPAREWRRPRAGRHQSGLTPRQLDVLALLGRGCTNAEIAEALYISEKTAAHHVSAILTQFGVPSRRAAVAHARTRGWLAVAAALRA